VKEKFKQLYNREFSEGFLLRHLSSVHQSKDRVRNKELLDAIREYLTDTEVDITESAQQIYQYYEGRDRGPKVEKEVREAESRLAQYGYDRTSFVQAIGFWNMMNTERAKIEHQH
jgi:hypothetical protein